MEFNSVSKYQQVMRLRNKGLSIREIGQKLGLSHCGVQYYIHRYNIPRKKQRASIIEMVEALLNDGALITTICLVLGCQKSTVYRIRLKLKGKQS